MTTVAEDYIGSLHARIRAVLGTDDPDIDIGPLAVLPGGHSGLTYQLETGRERLVVKAVPPGQRAVGRHDMLRQARIMRALDATDVGVPRICAVDDTEPAWFAMEYVEGESIEPVLDDPELSPRLAAARMRGIAELMHKLHRVQTHTLPETVTPLSPADELARWARTMGAVPPELVVGAGRLQDLLAASPPAPEHPVLVHGDFRLGNVICRGDRPVALIDWEIWSLGDPRVELGWFLLFADGTNFPGAGRVLAGLPTTDELTHLCRAGDPPAAQGWFDALAMFKMAAIMGHNLRRHREGRHHDPAQELLPSTIARLIENGLARLQ